jgi:hypothetical protein
MNELVKKIQYWATWLAYIAAIIAGIAAVIRNQKAPTDEQSEKT